MSKIKRIFTDWKVILLIILLIGSVYLINPTFQDGVAIRGVTADSAAAQAIPQPVPIPSPDINPRDREVIETINGQEITTTEDYLDVQQSLQVNQSITMETSRNTYFMTTKERFDENGTSLGVEDLGLNIMDKPKSNIRLGLDLAGGTRVLLEPDEEVSDEDLETIADNIEQRLNIFGVSDVTVRTTTDFFQNSFIIVEIAGSTEDEVRELLSEQGVFEAQIANQTAFSGGDEDIRQVCRAPECSGLDRQRNPCREIAQDQWTCGFFFSITISQEAAQRQANLTRGLSVVNDGGQQYLSENITLVLDGEVVDQLRIGASLRGSSTTNIQISGSGDGNSEQAARENALEEMRNLQTIMITGSLPVTLSIVRADTVSPSLGEDFLNEALIAGLLAILAVILVVTVRYREVKLSVPMAITMISEVTLIMGFAALINWNMDMAAIAAVIIAIGSGVDDQIVIADETLEGDSRSKGKSSWKDKLDKAFFIIMAAYFTLLVAMIPLWFAGAGLLRGFALTTVVGVTAGVLLTRPVFAHVLSVIIDDK